MLIRLIYFFRKRFKVILQGFCNYCSIDFLLMFKVKNLLRSVILVLVTGLFLALSTGIHLTVHHCSTINHTGLYLFQAGKDPCEHNESFPEPEGCCQAPVNNNSGYSENPDCCADTTIHFAVDDHITSPGHISIFSSNFLFFHPSSVILIGEKYGICNKSSNFESPPRLHGKELCCLNRQLLL
jgi:hypothetical protein